MPDRHEIHLTDNERLSELEPESVHLTVTSPPYVTTEFRRGQEFDYDGFISHFEHVCELVYRATVPGGRYALNVADIVTKYRYSDDTVIGRVPLGADCLKAAEKSGFRLLERFIWDKGYTRNFRGPLLGSYPYPMTLFNNNYFEYIFVLKKPGKRKCPQPIREQSRISLDEWRTWCQQWWRVESQTERFNFHRAIFPVEIPYRLIRMYSYQGDVVLDPYIGTGATMIAAAQCGRSSVGFEIDPACEEYINHRLTFEQKRDPALEIPAYQLIKYED